MGSWIFRGRGTLPI